MTRLKTTTALALILAIFALGQYLGGPTEYDAAVATAAAARDVERTDLFIAAVAAKGK